MKPERRTNPAPQNRPNCPGDENRNLRWLRDRTVRVSGVGYEELEHQHIFRCAKCGHSHIDAFDPASPQE
jgi:hypothetical protein